MGPTVPDTVGPDLKLFACQASTDAEAIEMANETPHPNPPRSPGREGRGDRRPHLARRRGPRIPHRRHQRGHHLDRNRALRRHEGKRHRPIWRVTGARNTASRNSSKSNTSAWAASTDSWTPMMGYPRYIPGAEWRRRCKCKSYVGATALVCAFPKTLRVERACAREPGSMSRLRATVSSFLRPAHAMSSPIS